VVAFDKHSRDCQFDPLPVTLDKLFMHFPLSPNGTIWSILVSVMSCSWEGNRRSCLVSHWPCVTDLGGWAQGLSTGDEHPTNTPDRV